MNPMRRARWLSTLAPPGAILALLAGATGSEPARAQTTAPQAIAPICSQSFLPLPDPVCTPGATNPDVRADTIASTICEPEWTKTVRPTTEFTDPLKIQQIAEYGFTDTSPELYEEDHLISLELGGAPRDPKNLWPEPRNAPLGESASSKDVVEDKLHRMVCDGTAGLVVAQQAIATDWRTAVAVASGSGNRVVAGAVLRTMPSSG